MRQRSRFIPRPQEGEGTRFWWIRLTMMLRLIPSMRRISQAFCRYYRIDCIFSAIVQIRSMRREDCLFCKMLAYEKETNRRIVAETEHFLALTPYAGRFAYELWLAPKAHQRDFGEMSAEERQELAALLRKMLGRVMGIREDIGYNICVMDGPRDTDFHWHIEILPRIGGFAGFEFATDCYICMVSPENAAVYYRKEEAE